MKKYAARWGIDTSHFDSNAARIERLKAANTRKPLSEILTTHSTYSRGNLKRRLYEEGLKSRNCEMCGQGEDWHGSPMSLVLDHINGIRDDNRVSNLRVVCPNCAATLPTHCGRGNRHPAERRACATCGSLFYGSSPRQQVCSQACAAPLIARKQIGVPSPESRKVERPPYEQLLAEIEATSYLAVGRKGVSDNAVRKWIRWYELERKRTAEERRFHGGEAA